MRMRSRLWAAALVGLGMAQAAMAQEPARLPAERGEVAGTSTNQQMANRLADQLRMGRLRNFDIDVAFRNGLAELTGVVADQAQRQEAIRIVRGMPGVERVSDRLSIREEGVTQVLAQNQPFPPAPSVLPKAAPGAAAPGGPALAPPPAPGGTGLIEPMPIFQAPTPSAYDLNPPNMPPYAWPTYAPYNNYSRVATPELYPYQAWPYIGPMYPFPKVPLGWRSVKLEWEDGHWWYKKVATKHDWWRVRYW